MGSKELERFIDNKSLVALRKFAALESQLKAAKEQHDEVVEKIKEAMIAHGVQRLDGDWGYITLAERTSYKAEDGALEEIWESLIDILRGDNIPGVDGVGLADKLKFTKPSLDTAKVKAEAVLTGQLPAGVTKSKTQYITKKLKDV